MRQAGKSGSRGGKTQSMRASPQTPALWDEASPKGSPLLQRCQSMEMFCDAAFEIGGLGCQFGLVGLMGCC